MVLFTFALAALGCERKAAPDHGAGNSPASSAAPIATGTVEGRVHFEGAPPPALARLPTNEGVVRQCGEDVEDRSLVVGDHGAIVGAVASLADAPAAPSASAADAGTLVIDQKGCVFLPVIAAARVGATVVMKNSDSLTHNVRANARGQELYNVALPITGMTLRRTLPGTPGEVKLHCDIHPWMNARIQVFAHPWFAQSDAQGRFRIPGVPAGHHTIKAWHPRLPEKTVEVDVPAGGTAKVDLGWQGSDVRPLD